MDRALKDWGWPVGALALIDEIGLDVAQHAGNVLCDRLGTRFEQPGVFQRMLGEGRLGRKAGQGFYAYDPKGKKKADAGVYSLLDWQPGRISSRDIADRCWLRMLGEVTRCIEDGIISNPTDVDIGVVLGTRVSTLPRRDSPGSGSNGPRYRRRSHGMPSGPPWTSIFTARAPQGKGVRGAALPFDLIS